jgi:hypothetical protein
VQFFLSVAIAVLVFGNKNKYTRHCKDHGYTKIMMKNLAKPLIYTVRGQVLQCGDPLGVSDEIFKFCLDHMQCWVRMAVETTTAEFPEWTVVNALGVCRLTSFDSGQLLSLCTADLTIETEDRSYVSAKQ